MIIAILREISFILDEDKHSVKYAKRAMSCTSIPKRPSSHWMAVIGKDEEDVLIKLRAQVVGFLQRMDLDPADFKFSYRYTSTDEHGQFWLLGDENGFVSRQHKICGA
jgi:hypothetical protein